MGLISYRTFYRIRAIIASFLQKKWGRNFYLSEMPGNAGQTRQLTAPILSQNSPNYSPPAPAAPPPDTSGEACAGQVRKRVTSGSDARPRYMASASASAKDRRSRRSVFNIFVLRAPQKRNNVSRKKFFLILFLSRKSMYAYFPSAARMASPMLAASMIRSPSWGAGLFPRRRGTMQVLNPNRHTSLSR